MVVLCFAGCFEGFIRSRRCIGDLERGRIDRDRHREHRHRRCTSLLRHLLALTLAPRPLPSGVLPGSTACALVAGAGTSARRAPRQCGTLPGTKNIAAIASAADAHRHAAAPAAIQPVALFPLLQRTPPQDWTAPCFTGLNAVRKIAPTGIAPLEARGFLTGFPGLHCLGVANSINANASARCDHNNHMRKTDIGASAADGGRLRVLRRRRRQQTEDDYESTTGPPVVKPRLSPETRGIRTPSTLRAPTAQSTLVLE